MAIITFQASGAEIFVCRLVVAGDNINLADETTKRCNYSSDLYQLTLAHSEFGKNFYTIMAN